jgi:signal transduction histidine kinase
MDHLVTDLLALAREGQDVGETQSVDLDTIAREAWSHVATDEASLRVESSGTIDADPDRLVELFENLYRNAAEHAGDAPVVTVGRLDGREGFFVADDGPGVDDDIDPFDTGVTTSDEGTGFGLPIVESIAEAHGWTVSVAQSADGGARFEFETA